MERYDAAHVWKRAREHQEAGQIYREILEAEPTDIEGHFRLGVLFQKQDGESRPSPVSARFSPSTLTTSPLHQSESSPSSGKQIH